MPIYVFCTELFSEIKFYRCFVSVVFNEITVIVKSIVKLRAHKTTKTCFGTNYCFPDNNFVIGRRSKCDTSDRGRYVTTSVDNLYKSLVDHSAIPIYPIHRAPSTNWK